MTRTIVFSSCKHARGTRRRVVRRRVARSDVVCNIFLLLPLCDSIIYFPSTFVVAGADSTANSICTMMDILSRNLAIQDKLRAELVEAQERLGTDIPHDELVALPYMDAFCRETLRLCVFIVCGCALNPLTFIQGTHPFHLSPESMSGPLLPLLELTSGYD